MPFCYGKTRMAWLPEREKMFIRFDTTHERDRQTDRHTDTQTDRHRMTAKAALDASIARQKSSDFHEILYTAADFELDERLVLKNEIAALNRLRVR